MKVAKSGDRYLVRLEHGEDILETVQRWCHGQGVINATIKGIGSIENPTLAHYRRDRKQFSEKSLTGIFEITSLMGNVGLVDGDEPLVHLHVTLADETMSAFGGHLVKGVCSATAELFITPLPTRFRKKFDEAVGLKVWDFDA